MRSRVTTVLLLMVCCLVGGSGAWSASTIPEPETAWSAPERPADGPNVIEQLKAMVRHAATDVARGRVAPPDRYEVLGYRFGGATVDGRGVPGLELIAADGPNASGFVHVHYRVTMGGNVAGETRATLRGSVFGPALVATRPLKRGEPIDDDSVEVTDSELTRIGETPLRAFDEIARRVPKRTIGIGRVITPEMIGAAKVVHRGDAVELRIERSGLRVTATGIALRDGAPGDLVEAENGSTGARVLARVREDGSLLVVRGALARRQR
jgi:flagella basal body P-ring formation protein FlgA